VELYINPPPLCHHGVDCHTFLPCNLKHLLLACQGSTPGFSTSSFSCSQTPRSMLWDLPTNQIKKIKGCVTSQLPASHLIDPFRSQQTHRKYARYGTSLKKSLENITVIYYKLFCITYITSININVF